LFNKIVLSNFGVKSFSIVSGNSVSKSSSSTADGVSSLSFGESLSHREVKAKATMSKGIMGNGGSRLPRCFSVIEGNRKNLCVRAFYFLLKHCEPQPIIDFELSLPIIRSTSGCILLDNHKIPAAHLRRYMKTSQKTTLTLPVCAVFLYQDVENSSS